MAGDETTLLMSIMAMASRVRQVFHFLCVVCVGKGFEDELSDNSDLLKAVRRVFLARNNPTYKTHCNVLYNPSCKQQFRPSKCGGKFAPLSVLVYRY
jgi:hypothetical protein